MNKRMVLISIIILLLDQILKLIIELNNISLNVINNFFYISYVKNNGAAFSILEGKTITLIIISIIMLLIIYSMSYSYDDSKAKDISFGLLYGGIFGNLIDRILYGYVRDYIEIHIFNYIFPIFNLADITIVCGVTLLLLLTIKGDLKNGIRSKKFRRKSKN